jgi:hypothetical protein
MEQRVSEFLDRLRDAHASSNDYPVDPLQVFLCNVLFDTDWNGKSDAKTFCELLLDKYRDIWYHGVGFLRNTLEVAGYQPGEIPTRDTHLLRIAQVIAKNNVSPDNVVRRVFMILEKIKRPTPQLLENDALLPSFGNKKASVYRIQFKNCWAELLRCSVVATQRDLIIKLLRIIPDSVMPHIPSSGIFASFFCSCFSGSGDVEVSFLAVSGLFHLVSRNNLGEPDDLYSRLYQLITPEAMKKSSQSNRVFQLLVKVLRSPLMPARLVPVFAKRMLRVAVVIDSPSLTLWLVVAAFNLMQAHPLVSRPLIHREESSPSECTDPFDLNCTDINEMSQAVERSSLWELELLMNHTDPSVVRMASLFKTNFFSRKAKRISSDDYLLITDEQLFHRERKYGTHGKAKKMKADIELDNITGGDSGKTDVSVAIGVFIPECREKLAASDTSFLGELDREYNA